MELSGSGEEATPERQPEFQAEDFAAGTGGRNLLTQARMAWGIQGSPSD
jgi:hypothetical protein